MDIYTEITERIIEQMEHGIIPWQKPWVGSDSTVSHATGRSYSILNQILLGKPGEYISFNQCAKEGGKIKKGAKSRMVVFWKILEDVDAETGDVKKIPLLKYSRVFHIDDCEGIKAKYAGRSQEGRKGRSREAFSLSAVCNNHDSAVKEGNTMTITKKLELMQEIDRTNKERIARYLNEQKKG